MGLDLEIYTGILNIPNLKVEKIEYSEQDLNIYCKIEKEKAEICPSCKKEVTSKREKYRRKVSDLGISGRKVTLHLLVHQYDCEDCNRTFSEKFDFVEPNKSYTKRQAKWVFDMSAQQSHYRVAALTGFSNKTIERICYNQIINREVNWDEIRRIGLDEFAFKKGHKDFITVIIDLDTNEIIDILEERSKNFLRTYFQSLGVPFCAQIEDFCSDMWGPFQDLAKEIFPNANIHVDRFHWTVHLNKVLDSERKSIRKENKDEDVFKGLKWKLIKRPENLNEQEIEDLKKAFNLNPKLEELYEMRNTFQAIFDTNFSYDFAKEQVDYWLDQAKSLKNKYLDKFTDLFHRHKKNILNYFINRISSGAVEGTNNLLRTVKRFTFNMTNFQHFKFRVFAYKT
jgi:transposase